MPNSRPFDETAMARVARDKEFARGLLIEAISVLGSEPEVASVLIGHYIGGTASEELLASAMGMTGTDARAAMLTPDTTPFVTFICGLEALCKAEGMSPLLSCLAPADQPIEDWARAHHRLALTRIEALMNADAGSPDVAELTALGERVAAYERLRFPHRKPTLAEKVQDLVRRVRGRKSWD
jgi:hypothetical protein